MKRLTMIILEVLSGTFVTLAQTADSTSKSIDGTTSGYSNGGAIGLVLLILLLAVLVMGYTWRKKKTE
jgi:hypothetical protein